MIKVNKYPEQKLEHFDPAGNSLGFLNDCEDIDLRIQIKNNSVKGYYLMFNNTKIDIDNEGAMVNWPKGMYDTATKLLNEYFEI